MIVGIFVGEILGVGYVMWGWLESGLEVVGRVDFVGFWLVGRG